MNQDISNKIIRTICYFTDNITSKTVDKLRETAQLLERNNYVIQTKRICSPLSIKNITNRFTDKSILLSIGSLSLAKAQTELKDFYSTQNVFFNIDLSNEEISGKHIQILFDIIKNKPDKTFNFTYTFNNKQSSPYFPSSSHETNGFSIGFQPTNLAENCNSLKEWFTKLSSIWLEIKNIFKNDADFLGIDSSIAPLFQGQSSFINFIKRLQPSFSQSVTTDIYMQISKFIREKNPCPVGLCGLMFPCLEDFELADEYNDNHFSVERNIFLSLHSGLGIDTYPVGVDENPKRITEILCLLQGLSNKYQKTLSARFVSDGKTKIGEKTNFQNQFLKDVVIRKL